MLCDVVFLSFCTDGSIQREVFESKLELDYVTIQYFMLLSAHLFELNKKNQTILFFVPCYTDAFDILLSSQSSI